MLQEHPMHTLLEWCNHMKKCNKFLNLVVIISVIIIFYFHSFSFLPLCIFFLSYPIAKQSKEKPNYCRLTIIVGIFFPWALGRSNETNRSIDHKPHLCGVFPKILAFINLWFSTSTELIPASVISVGLLPRLVITHWYYLLKNQKVVISKWLVIAFFHLVVSFGFSSWS